MAPSLPLVTLMTHYFVVTTILVFATYRLRSFHLVPMSILICPTSFHCDAGLCINFLLHIIYIPSRSTRHIVSLRRFISFSRFRCSARRMAFGLF